MKAEVEFLILPYDSADGAGLLDRLVDELENGEWVIFRAAVAFAKQSGNFRKLISALEGFTSQGGHVELTFGADVFGKRTHGSDYEAIETMLNRLEGSANFRLCLYHEPHRTFHPKLYIFANEAEERALVIVGSSNWTKGGLLDNVEADVAVKLGLDDDDHRQAYERLVEVFNTYWRE